jgi:hypothetical protein
MIHSRLHLPTDRFDGGRVLFGNDAVCCELETQTSPLYPWGRQLDDVHVGESRLGQTDVG